MSVRFFDYDRIEMTDDVHSEDEIRYNTLRLWRVHCGLGRLVTAAQPPTASFILYPISSSAL